MYSTVNLLLSIVYLLRFINIHVCFQMWIFESVESDYYEQLRKCIIIIILYQS